MLGAVREQFEVGATFTIDLLTWSTMVVRTVCIWSSGKLLHHTRAADGPNDEAVDNRATMCKMAGKLVYQVGNRYETLDESVGTLQVEFYERPGGKVVLQHTLSSECVKMDRCGEGRGPCYNYYGNVIIQVVIGIAIPPLGLCMMCFPEQRVTPESLTALATRAVTPCVSKMHDAIQADAMAGTLGGGPPMVTAGAVSAGPPAAMAMHRRAASPGQLRSTACVGAF